VTESHKLCPVCWSRRCISLDTPAGECPEIRIRALAKYFAEMMKPGDEMAFAREMACLFERVEALERKALTPALTDRTE